MPHRFLASAFSVSVSISLSVSISVSVSVSAGAVVSLTATPVAVASSARPAWRGGSQGRVEHAQTSIFAANRVDRAIQRSEVLARARTWAAVPVTYSMFRTHNGYRTDCSGYVSMAWRLGRSVTTSTMGSVTHPIAKSQLRPGDVLNWRNTWSGLGHVVLFEKWADRRHTSYWAYEQTPGYTKHRIVPYPYFSGHGGPYLPLRYNRIVDSRAVGDGHDVNRDGRADLLTRDNRGRLVYFRGRGNGRFAWGVQTSSGGHDLLELSADVNGDGRADLLGRNRRGVVTYYRGRGNGTFARGVRAATGWNNPVLLAADVTGDGYADLLARTRKGVVFLARGRGNGTFGRRVRVAHVGNYHTLLATDVNGDGFADLLGRTYGGQLFFYRGHGDGTFAHRVLVSGHGWTYDFLLAADVDGDGRADLLARDTYGRLAYLRGLGTGKFARGVFAPGHGWKGLTLIR